MTKETSFNTETLKALDEQVRTIVTAYIDDWLIYDRPRIEKCSDTDKFILLLRETGVDTVFLSGPELSYTNMLWSEACLDSGRSKKYILYSDGKISEINSKKAIALRKEAYSNLPEEYIEFSKEAFDNKERSLTLRQWKISKTVKMDKIALALATYGHLDECREYMDRLKAIAYGEKPDDFNIYVSSYINSRQLRNCEGLLFGAGIAADNTKEVMQKLGHIIMKKELYPNDDNFDVSEFEFTITDTIRKKAIKCLVDNGIPRKDTFKVLDNLGKELFNHSVSTIIDRLNAKYGTKTKAKSESKEFTR